LKQSSLIQGVKSNYFGSLKGGDRHDEYVINEGGGSKPPALP